jgi:hypothetical protein
LESYIDAVQEEIDKLYLKGVLPVRIRVRIDPPHPLVCARGD